MAIPVPSLRHVRRMSLPLAAAFAVFILPSLQAENYFYWDTNGNVAGAGGENPSGVWDLSTANWSKTTTNPNPSATVNGTAATTTYSGTQTSGTTFFSAGNDAIGVYTVSVDSGNGAIWARRVTIEEGAITFDSKSGTNSTLSIGSNSSITINAGASATFDNSLLISLAGAGTFALANNSDTSLVIDSAVSTGSGRIWTMTGSGSGGTVFNGVISSSGGITVNTAGGVTTLNAMNTYTGATTITAGTLALGSGGSIDSSVLSIGSAGLFDVSAKSDYSLVGISTTIALGELSSGRLDAGEGLLTYGGNLVVTFDDGFTLGANGSFDLFDFGSYNGTFSSLTVAGVLFESIEGGFAGQLGGVNYTFSNANGTLSAIPEPSTYAAIAGALALGAVGWRRRRAHAATS